MIQLYMNNLEMDKIVIYFLVEFSYNSANENNLG